MEAGVKAFPPLSPPTPPPPPAVDQGENGGNKSLLFGRGWPWSKA